MIILFVKYSWGLFTSFSSPVSDWHNQLLLLHSTCLTCVPVDVLWLMKNRALYQNLVIRRLKSEKYHNEERVVCSFVVSTSVNLMHFTNHFTCSLFHLAHIQLTLEFVFIFLLCGVWIIFVYCSNIWFKKVFE